MWVHVLYKAFIVVVIMVALAAIYGRLCCEEKDEKGGVNRRGNKQY